MKRTLNEERFGDLTEKRVCKKCEKEKLLKEFQFHSATGYFSKTCQDCLNEEKRTKYIPKENSTYIPSKECRRCGVKKLRTEENFTFINKKGGYRMYSKMCIPCYEEFKVLHGKKKVVREDDGTTKVCLKCKEDKSITEYYKYKSGFIPSFCIKCESARKKERVQCMNSTEKEVFDKQGRDNYKKGIVKYLMHTYRKFDFERNLETDLTEEYLKEQLALPCTYCSFPPTGLDRIDNDLGHLQSNCTPCCSECNTARNNNFTYEEMLILGQAIKEVKLQRKEPVLLDSVNKLLTSL